MADYNICTVAELKKILHDRELIVSGKNKNILVERLKGNDEYYNNEFTKMFSKYVPNYGRPDSREGRLLRAGGRLKYRHWNDGDSSGEIYSEFNDIFNDIDYHDRFIIDCSFSTHSDDKKKQFYNDLEIVTMIQRVVKYINNNMKDIDN